MTNMLQRGVDSLIATISPAWGNRRLAARARGEFAANHWDRIRHRLSAGGFGAGESSRDAQSWYLSRLSPDSALEWDRDEMNARADSAVKMYELGVSHQEGRVMRVVGTGLSVDPDIRARDGISQDQADRWNEDLREEWERTIENIGPNGEALWEIQQLMQRYWERRGEWFLLIGDKYDPFSPTTLRVEVLDPDQINTPPGKAGDPLCRMGVQFNADNQITGYWHRESHPGDTANASEKWVFYEATLSNGLPRVIHHFAKWWKGQHRGFPLMQAGLRRLKNADEYNDAELERNYVAACFAGFYSTESTEEEFAQALGLQTDSAGDTVQDIEPGTLTRLGPGETVNFSNPSGAPQTFEQFVQHQDRKFAASVGSSYEITTNDWRGITYSGGRIIWNIEDSMTRILQLGHKKSIQWIYRHFVQRCVVSPESLIDIQMSAFRDRPWLYWRARLIAPAKASIDPTREGRAQLIDVEAGLVPHSDLVEQKNGVPARQVYERIARNRTVMDENGINTTMPQMGRDQAQAPTQLGDDNQASADAALMR